MRFKIIKNKRPDKPFSFTIIHRAKQYASDSQLHLEYSDARPAGAARVAVSSTVLDMPEKNKAARELAALRGDNICKTQILQKTCTLILPSPLNIVNI